MSRARLLTGRLGAVMALVVTSLGQAARSEVDPCRLPLVVRNLLQMGARPGGVEYLLEATHCERSGFAPEDLSLLRAVARRDVSLTDGLAQAASLDARYQIRSLDNVIVVRPREAWEDPQHFLNQRLDRVALPDTDLRGALATIASALGGIRSPRRAGTRGSATPQMIRHFSLDLLKPTVQTALDQIVYQHGASVWEVLYCASTPLPEFSLIRIGTFDTGSETTGIVRHDAGGVVHEGCARVGR